jgi:S1-C subfamily serine protease
LPGAQPSAYQARLCGSDPDRDLAVLQVEAPRPMLRPVRVGTSRDLRVGQKVYAVGNPFGLDATLTTGAVTALGREVESAGRRRVKGVIRTDAATNPGNVGGPLLDGGGRVIGMNLAGPAPDRKGPGVGFALPVDEVKRAVPSLIRK